jgi:hypothetical protein
MKTNKVLRNQIFEIIKNQMKSNNPPETRQNFDRLIGMGFSDLDAKKLIGQCVAVEIFHVLKHKEPFDEKRYVSNLNKLPEEPSED